MGCADPTNWVTVARQTRWAKVKGLVQYCRFLAVLTGCLISLGQGPVPPVERQADGIRVAVGGGFLNIQPKTDSIVRVVFSPDRNPRVDDLVVVGPGNSLGARGGSPRHCAEMGRQNHPPDRDSFNSKTHSYREFGRWKSPFRRRRGTFDSRRGGRRAHG